MWSVERAGPEDAGEILDVQRKAFEANQRKARVPLPEMTETVAEFLEDLRIAEILVARQSDRIIGVVRYRVGNGSCEVYRLAVDPAYAHLDAGRSLMRAVEDAVRARGDVDQIVLETGLRDTPAIEFYLNLGYRPYELIPDDETELDRVRFRKRCSPVGR